MNTETLHVAAPRADAHGPRISDRDRGVRCSSNRTVASTATDYRFFVGEVLDEADATVPVVATSQGVVFGLALAAAGWPEPALRAERSGR